VSDKSGDNDKVERFFAVLRDHLLELQRRYGVASLGLFGSYVRGEEREDSDLDVLVEVNRTMGLFEFVALEWYLPELLGIKVDLVMKRGLKRRIGQSILKKVVTV